MIYVRECFAVPLTVVLCYKKISLGQMSMKRVQRPATDWHKIFTAKGFSGGSVVKNLPVMKEM